MNRKILRCLTILFLIVLGFSSLIMYFRFELLYFAINSSNSQSYVYRTANHLIIRCYFYNKEETRDKIINKAEQNKFNNASVVLLGVIGDPDCYKVLNKKLGNIEIIKRNMFEKYEVRMLFDSICLIKNKETIFLFKRLREKLENDNHKYNFNIKYLTTTYSVARGLYLLTGERFVFDSLNGTRGKIPVTEELSMANKIINESTGRLRTLSELTFLLDFQLPIRESDMLSRLRVIER